MSRVWVLAILVTASVACSSGPSTPCVEDSGLPSSTPLTVSGSFDGVAFSDELVASSCSPAEAGRAVVRCSGDTIIVEGALALDGDGVPGELEVQITLGSAFTSTGSNTYAGDDGANAGVWVSGGGPSWTGASDDAVSNTLNVDVFAPGTSASGTFSASWAGDYTIDVSGSFDADCSFSAE
jgi:hypothetical protein